MLYDKIVKALSHYISNDFASYIPNIAGGIDKRHAGLVLYKHHINVLFPEEDSDKNSLSSKAYYRYDGLAKGHIKHTLVFFKEHIKEVLDLNKKDILFSKCAIEILKDKRYQGNVTRISYLTHLIVHELSHLIQIYIEEEKLKIYHNKYFKKAMNALYSDGIHEKIYNIIRSKILEECPDKLPDYESILMDVSFIQANPKDKILVVFDNDVQEWCEVIKRRIKNYEVLRPSDNTTYICSFCHVLSVKSF